MLEKLNPEDLNPKPEIHPPVASVRETTGDEKENEWIIDELASSFTDQQIELLFPYYALNETGWYDEAKKELAYNQIRSCCVRLRLYPLVKYTIIKNRKAHTYEPAEDYPMFLVDEESESYGKTIKHKVIYQPLAPNPANRYLYDGKAPRDCVHGIAQAKAEWRRRENDVAVKMADNTDSNGKQINKIDPAKKLSEVLMIRELADVFGPALIGYWCCWYNQVNGIISDFDFGGLERVSDKVYQVINNTDQAQKLGHEAALRHLDMFNLELPKTVQRYAQQPAEPIVSLYDYLTHKNAYDLKELLKDALPYRFWEMEADYDGPRGQRTMVGWRYVFDNVQAYNFLNKMGFHRMAVEDRKTDYIYIQLDKNIVYERIPTEVKNFIHKFLKDRRKDKTLRNTLYKSAQLNESSLSNLEDIAIEFTHFDADRQYMFFNNCTWEISAVGIKQFKPGQIDRYVWERDVIQHNVSISDPPFTITKLQDGPGYDIKVNHNRCMFFNYLINTSRIHWRKELEEKAGELDDEEKKAYLEANKFTIDGELLSIEERLEQKEHLINKIFALGYLMHRYKDRSKSWAVVAMDNNHNADGKSHGRTGKSICFNQALPEVLRSIHHIPGTNPDKTKDPHIFHGLTKYHQATIIDDADKYLNFRFFFEFITGDQVVNPKQSQPYTISFSDLGKLIWLTNFSFSTDSSTNGRILYTVFSDYYHEKTDQDDFKESRSPKDDFGKSMFLQFDENEWNEFFNTMANCLKFALRSEVKLNPPMDNVTRRNMQREMGINFESWAEVYFSEQSGNLDKFLIKDEVYQEFMRDQNLAKGSYSETKFKSSIKYYCVYSDFIFCPEELINDKKNKRTIHQVPDRKMNKDGEWMDGSKKKSKELIYIQTNIEKPLCRVLPGEENLPF